MKRKVVSLPESLERGLNMYALSACTAGSGDPGVGAAC